MRHESVPRFATTTFVCKCCLLNSLRRRTRNLDQPKIQYLWLTIHPGQPRLA